jgi:hypothetical protein
MLMRTCEPKTGIIAMLLKSVRQTGLSRPWKEIRLEKPVRAAQDTI